MSALKRDFSSQSKELKQQGANFRRHIHRLYKHDVFFKFSHMNLVLTVGLDFTKCSETRSHPQVLENSNIILCSNHNELSCGG